VRPYCNTSEETHTVVVYNVHQDVQFQMTWHQILYILTAVKK
jgi:hypothetical protein